MMQTVKGAGDAMKNNLFPDNEKTGLNFESASNRGWMEDGTAWYCGIDACPTTQGETHTTCQIQCPIGAEYVGQYFCDEANPASFCFCTGTAAPSRYDTCHSGTLYNPSLPNCDWAINVDVLNQGCPSVPNGGLTTTAVTPTVDPGIDCDAEPPCDVQYYPHPCICTKYYNCAHPGTIHRIAHLMNTAAGLVWDPTINNQNWPYNYACTDYVAPPPTPCSDTPCQNGGVCTDDENNTENINGYTCECPYLYTGTNCDTFVPSCDWQDSNGNSPCLNGGTCNQLDTTNVDHECACAIDNHFTGGNCDAEIPPRCSSTPCLNGAGCTDSSDHSTYTCQCAYLYSLRVSSHYLPPNTRGRL